MRKLSESNVNKCNTVFLSQKVIHTTNLALDTLPQITPTDKHNRRSPLPSPSTFFLRQGTPPSLVTLTSYRDPGEGSQKFWSNVSV